MIYKLFVIKKYVMATSAKDAIRKERSAQIDDVWIDENWKEKHLNEAMGFRTPTK